MEIFANGRSSKISSYLVGGQQFYPAVQPKKHSSHANLAFNNTYLCDVSNIPTLLCHPCFMLSNLYLNYSRLKVSICNNLMLRKL
ncbi:hypothetical protein QL285_074809 [Trifolium repens]|nr:hypothetical protein QL285_074809 [Trifolium repens]